MVDKQCVVSDLQYLIEENMVNGLTSTIAAVRGRAVHLGHITTSKVTVAWNALIAQNGCELHEKGDLAHQLKSVLP